MADLADQASDIIQDAVDSGIARARAGEGGAFGRLRPTGFCRWCDHPIKSGRLHCPPSEDSCAEDHERYLKFNGENYP